MGKEYIDPPRDLSARLGGLANNPNGLIKDPHDASGASWIFFENICFCVGFYICIWG